MPPKKHECMVDIVRRLMYRRGWTTVFELQSIIAIEHKRWLSDAGLSARIRDQRKSKHGGWEVQSRPGKQGKAWQYKLVHPEVKTREAAGK